MLAVYGDARLWFLIAQANGLSSDADLRAGQTLNVPNRVTNLYASAETVRPYSPGEIVGDTTPTLPDPPPPPPPPQGRGGCGGFGQVLVMVVSIAVAVAMPATMGWTAGQLTLGQAMTIGAVSNIAGQVAGNIAGVQKGFNFRSFATSVISAGITQRMGLNSVDSGLAKKLNLSGWQAAAVHAAAGSIVGQGVGIVIGAQQRFDWRAVAGAAVGVGLTTGLSATPGIGERVVGNIAGQLVARGRVNFAQVAGDVFGNLLGNALAGQIYERREQQLAAREDAREAAMWQAVGSGAAPSRQSPIAARPPESSWRMMARSGGPVSDAAMWQAVGSGAAPSQQSPVAARPPESYWRMMASSGGLVSDAAEGVPELGVFDEWREQQLAAREDVREAAMWQTVGGGAADSQQSTAQQRVHALLRAHMSDAAYLVNPSDPTKGYRGTLPSGVYSVEPGEGVLSALAPEWFENRDTGFAARLFYLAESDTYTLAFRGTDNIQDFITGNRQAVDPRAPQYEEARRLVEELQVILGDKLTDLTGHSLGGGLAAAMSMMTGLPATTFNAAGLNTSTVTRAGGTWSDERSQTLITNYRVKDEVLTSLQERGSIGSIPLAASALFVGPVAGLALQGAAAALPDAAGRQVTLDAIGTSGTPMSWPERNNLVKMTPIALHGMDYVLRGMSAYAKQGRQ
ncbi:MAG: DUF2974 domain-containing protein [Rhodocyclaceae bacterium]|nr:DUF2974 domain-containing protein [Rhodocyclaceae bacterium]